MNQSTQLATLKAILLEGMKHKDDIPVYIYQLLLNMYSVLTDTESLEVPFVEEQEEERVIISCDASITHNPGGNAAVGFVIENPPTKTTSMGFSAPKSTTNNQAEYDAVYYGLQTFVNLNNNPGKPIEIRSDSKIVISQLNGEMECHDIELEKRRNGILELVKALPVPVIFNWRPRNSTPALKQANYEAQDYLKVRRH